MSFDPNGESSGRQQALVWLSQLQESGQLGSLLAQLPDHTSPMTSAGSMHDGCKRRLESWELVGEPAQAPVTPGDQSTKNAKKKSSPKSSSEVELPDGVESLTQWGKTMVTLPKYASRKMSYDEMVSRAATEKQKGDPELHEYLIWVTQNENKSGKVKDFSSYLKVTGWTAKQVTTYFPGTKDARIFVD